jgi:hypothetical protein
LGDSGRSRRKMIPTASHRHRRRRHPQLCTAARQRRMTGGISRWRHSLPLSDGSRRDGGSVRRRCSFDQVRHHPSLLLGLLFVLTLWRPRRTWGRRSNAKHRCCRRRPFNSIRLIRRSGFWFTEGIRDLRGLAGVEYGRRWDRIIVNNVFLRYLFEIQILNIWAVWARGAVVFFLVVIHLVVWARCV